MLERDAELLALPIEQAEVEVRLRVVRAELDGAQQVLLGLVELPLLEEDQAEVGVEDEDVGVLAHEAPVDDLGLGERIRLEVDQAEEVEDVGVVGAQALGLLELAPRLGITPFLERFTAAVVMKEEDSLIEGGSDGGTILGHGGDCTRMRA